MIRLNQLIPAMVGGFSAHTFVMWRQEPYAEFWKILPYSLGLFIGLLAVVIGIDWLNSHDIRIERKKLPGNLPSLGGKDN